MSSRPIAEGIDRLESTLHAQHAEITAQRCEIGGFALLGILIGAFRFLG